MAVSQSLHTLPGPKYKCNAEPQNVSHSSSLPSENVVQMLGFPAGPQQHAAVPGSPVGCGVGGVGDGVGDTVGDGVGGAVVGANWHPAMLHGS